MWIIIISVAQTFEVQIQTLPKWTFPRVETSQSSMVTQTKTIFPVALNVFFAYLNFCLSIGASLGNALILIVLHKVYSVHPPTKLLFRCLAVTDLLAGVITQPLFATLLLLNAYV